MKVNRRTKRFLAALLSVAMVLSMAIGVQPVKQAKADTGDDVPGVFTIYYNKNVDPSGFNPEVSVTIEDEHIDVQDGVITLDADKLTALDGGTWNLPEPSRTHYEFTGWTDSEHDDAAITQVTPTANEHASIKASWQATTYNLAYNDGDEPESPEVAFTVEDIDGLLAVEPANDNIPEHKRFNTWYTDEDCENALADMMSDDLESLIEASGNDTLTLYAGYVPAEYNVTFEDSDGGNEYTSLATTYPYSEESTAKITLPAIQTEEEPESGYTWKWVENGTAYAGGANYPTTGKDEDLTFIEAQVPAEYSITYTEPTTGSHGNAAEIAASLAGYDAYDITDAGQVTFPTQDDLDDDSDFDLDDGYEFVGWYLNDDPDEEVIASTEGLTGNITLVASYAPIEYTLTLSGLSGITESSVDALTYQGYDASSISTDGTATKTYTVENPVSLPIELEIEGKEFVNWTNNSGGAVIEGWDAGDKTGNVNVTAHFKDIYTVTYDLNGGSWPENFDEDTLVTSFDTDDSDIDLSSLIPEKAGYHFVEWRTDIDDHATAIASIDCSAANSNVTVVAYYEVNSYTLSLNVGTDATFDDDSFTETPADSGVYQKTIDWDPDPEATNAIDLSGFVPTWDDHTLAWTLGGSTVSEIDLADYNDGDDIVVTADWTALYTITYALNGGQIVVDETHTYDDDNPLSETITDDDLVNGVYTMYVPTKDNNTLVKWSVSGADNLSTDYTEGITVDDPTVSAEIDLDGIQAGDEIILEANWQASVDVAYDYGDGTGSDENPTYFLTNAESITIINPTLDGYDFDANGVWVIDETPLTPTATTAKSASSPGSKTYAVSSILAAIGSETSATFTADYGNAIHYDVTYSEPSTGSHGNAGSLQAEWYSVEDLLTLPLANELTIDDGYEFVGWYVSGDTEQTIITTTEGLTGDLALVAKYAAIEYGVTLTGLSDITAASATALANVSGTGEGFVIDEFGVGTGTFTVEDLNDQNKLVIPDIEKAGYDFNGWKLGTATAVTSLELTKEQLMAEPTLAADFSEETYTISLTGIDTSEEVGIVEEAGFVVADDQDPTCTTYVKSVTISTAAFHLPDLSDAADEHYYFAGWRATGTTGDPDDITIEGTVADASYDPVYTEYPKVTATFTLNGGAFTTEDTTKLAKFGYVATSNENIVIHVDDYLSDELEAITPLPAPAKTDSIFSGWSLAGFTADDPLVMEYDIADDILTAATTDGDTTLTLTANYVAAPNEGETVVVAEGSARSNIDAAKLAEIKSLVESELGTLPSGAIAITKVVVNEESTTAHDGDTLDGTIEATLTGGTVRKAFVDATITTYVTVPGSFNNYSWTHSDLGQVLDITYDGSIVPAGVTATDLKMIVREHDASNGSLHTAAVGNPTASLSYDTFTKLAAQPTAGEEVDGTYWVDSATGDTHVYSSRYSTFAFGYATGGYYVTFNTNGGTFSDGTTSKQVYDTVLPSAPPTATRSGYTLTGWTDSDGHAFEPNAALSGDKVFTAQWQKNSTPPAPGPGGGGSGGGGTPGGGGSNPSATGGTLPPSPTPTATAPTIVPTTAPPAPTASAAPTTAPTTEPDKGPAPEGTKITTADGYVIVSNGDGTATLTGFKDSGATTLSVGTATHNSFTYSITAISNNAVNGTKLTKVIIGKDVKKLGAKAFYDNPELGTVIVKSGWLTKKSRVGKNSFGKTKKGIWFKFKLNKKKFKKAKKAFKKKAGAKKPRFKRLK